MKKLLLVAAGIAALATVPASAATNLLVNGSFEANGGSFDGWTISGGNGGSGANLDGADTIRIISYGQNGAPYYTYVAPNNTTSLSPDAVGSYAAYFVADNANQFLSQTVTLDAGTYLAGFDYYSPSNGAGNPNNATLTATLNGTAFTDAISAASTPVATWINAAGQQVFDVKTTGKYSFAFSSGQWTAKDLVVDRAYLIAAVPEPATWAMMLVGFGMVAGVARYRRRATNVRFA